MRWDGTTSCSRSPAPSPCPALAEAVGQERQLTQVGLFPAQQLIIAAASLAGLFVQQLPTSSDQAANSPVPAGSRGRCGCYLKHLC